jgi:osmotically-inducible protein OsmY
VSRRLINKIKVNAIGRTDAEIRDDVLDSLAKDPATESYEVIVAVDDGVVTLSGQVDSYAEKSLCAMVAKGVKGVEDVKNKIRYDWKSERPDSEIKAEIEKRLYADVRVDDGLIMVAVDDGKVTLSGNVGSAAEKRQARYDAYVAGVQSVDDSDLEVKWWARDEMRREYNLTSKTDSKIEKAVEDAFLYDPRVRSFDIDAEADFGTVTLTGTVDNLEGKQTAEEDAKNTLGVRRVRNFLKVRPMVVRTDEGIATDIRSALLLDPYVERHKISVSVYKGKAYLRGTVDSSFEKSRAEEAASGVKGVVDVQNNLLVSYTPPKKYDWEIKDDIESEFFWSPFVDGEDLTVTVQDGVATLEGSVEDWGEYQAAQENAIEGGAESVINNLEIR